jgi:hypothetical protein
LLRPFGEQRAIGETDEVAVEGLACQRQAQIGADAGRLTRGQRDAEKRGYATARA